MIDMIGEVREEVRPYVTPERAKFVRQLRIDKGYTWRRVAEECHEAWKATWSPPSNQIYGMLICEAAENLLDDHASPWNS